MDIEPRRDSKRWNRDVHEQARGRGCAATSDETSTAKEYDGNGNVTAVTLSNYVGGAWEPQRTTYIFDAYDRPVSETLPPVGGQVRCTTNLYYRDGSVKRVTDPKQQARVSWYDRAGRLIGLDLLRANATLEEARTNFYDKAGHLVRAGDLNGVSEYGYDALYRLVSETRTNVSLRQPCVTATAPTA